MSTVRGGERRGEATSIRQTTCHGCQTPISWRKSKEFEGRRYCPACLAIKLAAKEAIDRAREHQLKRNLAKALENQRRVQAALAA